MKNLITLAFIIITLAACGRNEKFVGGTASLEVLPSNEAPIEAKAEIATVTVAIEVAEEVLTSVEEVAKVEVVEENNTAVVIEVEATVEVTAVLAKHCTDGRGQDGSKNKHCK